MRKYLFLKNETYTYFVNKEKEKQTESFEVADRRVGGFKIIKKSLTKTIDDFGHGDGQIFKY